MGQAFWIFFVVTLGVFFTIAVVSIAQIGIRAYTSGSAPGAPEAFTSFASQLLRVTTVIIVVGTTLALVLKGKTLDSAVTGILSGIAGYVLGGSEKTPRLAQAKSQDSNKAQGSSSKP
jgi:hypothetical protein